MEVVVKNEEQTRSFGQKLGQILCGGDLLELVGDVGAGKTTLVRGLACGLGIVDPIQSPTFTISRSYQTRDGLELRHYDFYRLEQAGIMKDELSETIHDQQAIIVIEWAGAVEAVLPKERLMINIVATGENERQLTVEGLGQRYQEILEKLR